MFIWVLISIFFTGLWCFLYKVKVFQGLFLCYFKSPSEKGTNTFWRVWGIIDGFKKSHRKIYSGVENIADELMSSVHFCTIPKGDISNYWFIFRKPYLLGKELNNTACSRWVTMLYLYIKNGKYAMKI